MNENTTFTGWRKSSRSSGDSNCVEVGTDPTSRAVGVRDTKRRGHGDVLRFGQPAWHAFLTHVRTRAEQ